MTTLTFAQGSVKVLANSGARSAYEAPVSVAFMSQTELLKCDACRVPMHHLSSHSARATMSWGLKCPTVRGQPSRPVGRWRRVSARLVSARVQGRHHIVHLRWWWWSYRSCYHCAHDHRQHSLLVTTVRLSHVI